MELTLDSRREKKSRLRFLKQQTTWLKGDLRQKNPYSGKPQIQKWIAENIDEMDKLKNLLFQ